MLIYFKPVTRTVYGYNTVLGYEEAIKYIDEGSGCIWLDIEKFPSVGEEKEVYLTSDNKLAVREKTEPEPQPEVSLQELAENQMIIMQALADLYEGGANRG